MKINLDMLIPPDALVCDEPYGVLLCSREEYHSVMVLLEEEGILWGNGILPTKYEPSKLATYFTLSFYMGNEGPQIYYTLYYGCEEDLDSLAEFLSEEYGGRWHTVEAVLIDNEPCMPLCDLGTVLSIV